MIRRVASIAVLILFVGAPLLGPVAFSLSSQSSQASPSTAGEISTWGSSLTISNETSHYCAQGPGCITAAAPDGIDIDTYEFKVGFTGANGIPGVWILHFPVCNCTISTTNGPAVLQTLEPVSNGGTVLTLESILVASNTMVLNMSFNSLTGVQTVDLLNLQVVPSFPGAGMSFLYDSSVQTGQKLVISPYPSGNFVGAPNGGYLTANYGWGYTIFGAATVTNSTGVVFGQQPGTIQHRWGWLNSYRNSLQLEDSWAITAMKPGDSSQSIAIALEDNADLWGNRSQLGGFLWVQNGTNYILGTGNGAPAFSIVPNTGCSKVTLSVPLPTGVLTGSLVIHNTVGGGCTFEWGALGGSLTLGSQSYTVSGVALEFGCLIKSVTGCTNTVPSPTMTTALSSNTIPVGGTVSASATLSGSTPTAGGSITFYYSPVDECPVTAGATQVGSSVPVTGPGTYSASVSPTLNTPGTYYWYATYSGDSNNMPTSSLCESLTVGLASPTITTSLSATTIPVGDSVYDTATLSGATSTAGGTVTYEYFSSGSCAGTPTVVGTPVAVSNGAVPDSASQGFPTSGSYGWKAIYSGDSGNNPATSPCEPLTVGQSTSLSTSLSESSVTEGVPVSDAATLSGVTPSAGGNITFYYSTSNTCPTVGATEVGSPVQVSGPGTYPSAQVSFNSVGTYYWYAAYSGDANNSPATSPCEPLQVALDAPTISLSLSSSTITVGGSVTLSASLSGASGNAGGTVTYGYFTSSACTGTPTVLATVTVSGGVVPSSGPETFSNSGTYYLVASYSGDSNNTPATSSCAELSVAQATPTIATVLSATSVNVGNSVYDTATLSGATSTAGGTVTYEYFSGSSCTGTAFPVGTPVTVVNGQVPNSSPQTFISKGVYGWEALYSGDANNSPATSSCELMSATGGDSTTTALVKSANWVTIGTNVTLTAKVTDTSSNPIFPITGTVMWTDNGAGGTFYPSPPTCTLSGSSNPATCSVIYSPPPTEPSNGVISFTALYTGDSAHSISVGGLKIFVLDTATTVTLSTSQEVVGNIVPLTASATVTDVRSAGSTPAGTMTWYDGSIGGTFSSLTCTVVAGTGNSASCSVTYTPPLGIGPSSVTLRAIFMPSDRHTPSYSVGRVSIIKRTTSTQISATPTNPGPSTLVTLVVNVTDASPGTTTAPTGTVSFTANVSGGTFSSTSCSLVAVTGSTSQSTCTVTYTTSSSFSGPVIITAKYNGDATQNLSSGAVGLT